MPNRVPEPFEAAPRQHPFRRAVLRGVGIVMPPILTVVIFLWIGSTLEQYIMRPVTAGAKNVLAWELDDSQPALIDPQPTGEPGVVRSQGREYVRLADGRYVPYADWDLVRRNLGREPMPSTAAALYQRWVEIRFLRPWLVVPLFVVAFVVVMYLVGRFLAAGIGRVLWNLFERGVQRLPLVSNVYGSVKQVTDFMFSESELQFTRIVAIEYPRKGIWSLALVTSESLEDLRRAAGEPVLACLVPTSPMPVTGYTVTVRKREAVDLNLTVDQALQFIISCGVVIPPQQMSALAGQEGLPGPTAPPAGSKTTVSA